MVEKSVTTRMNGFFTANLTMLSFVGFVMSIVGLRHFSNDTIDDFIVHELSVIPTPPAHMLRRKDRQGPTPSEPRFRE